MSQSRGKVKSGGRSGRDGAKERQWREIELRDREAGSKQASTTTSCRKEPPLLAPVVFVNEPRGDSAKLRDVSAERQLASIEIVLKGGTTVCVPPHSTPEQLGMVLSVLEQARC